MNSYAFCLISYRFNFLAQATIETLPKDVDLFVLHVDKDQCYKNQFRVDRPFKELGYWEDTVNHHDLLNQITFERSFPGLEAYDWLIMIDHDVIFNDPAQLKSMLNQHCNNDVYLLKAFFTPSKWARRTFFTFPFMLIRYSTPWSNFNLQRKWDIVRGPMRDTGQFLADELKGLNLISSLSTSNLASYQHIGSAWMTSVDELAVLRRSEDVFMQLLDSGVLKPTTQEIDRMLNLNTNHEFALRVQERAFKVFQPI